jgi:hypothetical protein
MSWRGGGGGGSLPNIVRHPSQGLTKRPNLNRPRIPSFTQLHYNTTIGIKKIIHGYAISLYIFSGKKTIYQGKF